MFADGSNGCQAPMPGFPASCCNTSNTGLVEIKDFQPFNDPTQPGDRTSGMAVDREGQRRGKTLTKACDA